MCTAVAHTTIQITEQRLGEQSRKSSGAERERGGGVSELGESTRVGSYEHRILITNKEKLSLKGRRD